jgi:Tetratricopeptide repeat
MRRWSAGLTCEPGASEHAGAYSLAPKPARQPQEGKTAGVVFVADDLAAWLVGVLADAGRRNLTRLVLGSEQERALRQAAAAAIESTAMELDPLGGGQAGQLAMVVSEVFRDPAPDARMVEQATLLEALQAGIAKRLAVLDDAAVTGTGQSSAEVLGVPGNVLAQTLAGHLVREIMVRGSGGGPLAPLAGQLNHDVTHLQGQRLEGKLAQLADQVTLAQAGSATVASQPVRLLPRPALLAGREELLAGLDDRLTGAGAERPQVVALCGLGGVGKTSVALEYAHRHLAEVGVAWQFACEDPAVLAAGFGELAAQLGARDLLDARDPVASVHGVLAASPGEWLLVFDNAPDWASVAEFLPPAGRGRVLITSRNQNWPPGQGMDVPVLDPEVAAEFLVNRTGDQDRQAALDLAGEFGGLPLALEQAAAYIHAIGGALAGYLAAFRERGADLLARGEPTGYGKTIATTWALAFGRLERDAPEAVGLLRLLACCAPEPVPLHLLLQTSGTLDTEFGADVAPVVQPLLGDPLATGDAVAALRRFSLVRPAGDGLVLVHRLVQAVTLAQMPSSLATQWRQAAAALIDAAIPADTGQPETWAACAALLPHARITWSAASDGKARITDYLLEQGAYVAARDLWREVHGARKQILGPDHVKTLRAWDGVAYCTGRAGDPAEALEQYAAMLPVFERVHGREHLETLIIRQRIAEWTGAQDPAEARDKFAALVPFIERAQGPDAALYTRFLLANAIGNAGDPARARDEIAALLPAMERFYDPQHMMRYVPRFNLAVWTGLAGDPAAARDQLASFLPAFEQFFGAESLRTLDLRHNLARWTGEAGDAAGARDQYATLLPVRERVLGPEHPATLDARDNLAYWTTKARR